MPESRKVGESKHKLMPHQDPDSDGQEPSPDKIQEFILTINSATSELIKVEKLEMGQRQELSDDEYSSLSEAFSASAAEGYSQYEYDPYAMLYAAYAIDPYRYGAYAQGAYDYAVALASADYDLSAQEGYAQAMSDYADALAASYGSKPKGLKRSKRK